MQLTMPHIPARPRLMRFALVIFLLHMIGFSLAGLYWYLSGRLSFSGHVESSVLVFSPDLPGTVAKVLVAEGDTVRPGQELLRLDDAGLRSSLAREREKLALLEAALPPEYLRTLPSHLGEAKGAFSASSDPAHAQAAMPQTSDQTPDVQESREQRLARQMDDERQTRMAEQEASVAEAQALFNYNRAQMLFTQGRATSAQLDAARHAREYAAQRREAAKKDFERQSHARAATEVELRRARSEQEQSPYPGTSPGMPQAEATPASLRIAAFEAQQTLIRQMEARLAAAVLRTPMAGVVADLSAQPGDVVSPGQPVAHVFPSKAPVSVSARVTEEEAARLKKDQACTVAIAASPYSPFQGRIRSVLPRIASPGMNATAREEFKRHPVQVRIQLELPPEFLKDDASPLLLPDLATAEITVRLREEPQERPREETQAREEPRKESAKMEKETPPLAAPTAPAVPPTETPQAPAAPTEDPPAAVEKTPETPQTPTEAPITQEGEQKKEPSSPATSAVPADPVNVA